ncbi:MAG: hypothetical protein ACLFU4_06735 [Opitutales bacterium]
MQLWKCLGILGVLLLYIGALNASGSEATTDPDWEPLSFRIEDSRAFVGIAPVYLSVSELKPEDGFLVGTYEIKVPLKHSKNDWGKIVLPLDSKVEELGAEGGVLRGKAHSDKKKKKTSEIVCEIIPEKDQAIRLAITTEHRTIEFKSRYTVIDADADS